MKIGTTLSILFAITVHVSAQPKHVDSLSNGDLVIENFENGRIGDLPRRWYNLAADGHPYTYTGEERKAYQYQILEENGNKYLEYSGTSARHLNFPTKDVKEIDIYKTPILSWRWRVFDLPKGANEKDDNLNDTAASIYVVFDFGHVLFKRVPKSIKYTWSTSLKVGTEVSKLFGNQKIVVVESGPQKEGQWITFQRNIVEDYKRLFGDDPPSRPLAILILSDGDSTHDYVRADYDDIMLKKSN